MTIQVTKEPINLREKLNELETNKGLKGNEILQAETAQEVRSLIGAGRKNLIINGGFDVWQRGTSFTSSTSYHADRWTTNLSAETINISKTVDGVQINVVTGGNYGGIIQNVEGIHKLRGKTITLSYDIRGGQGSTGIVPPLFRSYVSEIISGSATVTHYSDILSTVSTSWQRFSATYTLTENSTSTASDYLQLILQQTTGATSGCDFEIKNVQLELGSVATDFEHRSYGEELALCQRYYETGSWSNYFRMTATSEGYTQQVTYFKTTKRATPTITTTWSSNPTQPVNIYSIDGFTSLDTDGGNHYMASYTADAEL